MAALAKQKDNRQMMNSKQKIVVVCGPTASGKTSLAISISQRFAGEMIAADSMQVYKGLIVGTAAVTPEEAQGIPQHLTGFLTPDRTYSVAEYVQDAAFAIKHIAAKKHIPVLCGGTGLYIKSLVNGITFTADSPPQALRNSLEAEWVSLGGEEMLCKLAKLDAEHASRLHYKDKKRILRSLEQFLHTGKTATQREKESRPAERPYNALLLGVKMPTREDLYHRINLRVDDMVENGLLQEALMVYNNQNTYVTASQAIGYKEFFPYFEHTAALADCINRLKQATRNYAKRQLTWFTGMPDIHWLDGSVPTLHSDAEKLVHSFLQGA